MVLANSYGTPYYGAVSADCELSFRFIKGNPEPYVHVLDLPVNQESTAHAGILRCVDLRLGEGDCCVHWDKDIHGNLSVTKMSNASKRRCKSQGGHHLEIQCPISYPAVSTRDVYGCCHTQDSTTYHPQNRAYVASERTCDKALLTHKFLPDASSCQNGDASVWPAVVHAPLEDAQEDSSVVRM